MAWLDSFPCLSLSLSVRENNDELIEVVQMLILSPIIQVTSLFLKVRILLVEQILCSVIPETTGLYVEGFSLWTKLVSFMGVMYKAGASRREFGNGKVDSMFSLFIKLRLNTESRPSHCGGLIDGCHL